MGAVLFSDFVCIPTCVRCIEDKKMFKVAIGKLVNNLVSVY